MSRGRPLPGFARELLVVAFAVAATLAATWPLGLHLFTFERLSDRQLDDYVYWWDFWWLHQALMVRHVDPFFCPDVFWPHGASLVLSPHAFPCGLLALPLQAALGELHGAVAAVKLLGFASFPLAIWGTSLLLRRLGVPLVASVLAGCLLAFAPFRMLQLGRIHYLAGALTPWFLHAALVAMRTGRWRWLLAASTWFALAGATDASLLLELPLAAGALWGFELLRAGPGERGRATLRLLACGVGGALLLSPLLVRFVQESRVNTGADVAVRLDFVDEPGISQRLLSPDLDGLIWLCTPALHAATLLPPRQPPSPRGVVLAPPSSARLAADVYESLRPVAAHSWLETVAAALVVGVVAAALLLGARERGAWCFLILAAIGFTLALGPYRGAGDAIVEMPYAWLARVVPGMAAGRYPPAHLRLLQLGIAAVAALALMQPRRWLVVAGGAAALCSLAIAPLRPFRLEPVHFEEAHERIAADPRPGNVLELPPRREVVLRRMALGQILHQRPLMAGPLTRVPDSSLRFFTEEPVVRRFLHPPPPTTAEDPQLAREIAENLASLERNQVRFIVIRRALFGFDPAAWDWLIWYLVRHDFSIEPTREGHLLVKVDGE